MSGDWQKVKRCSLQESSFWYCRQPAVLNHFALKRWILGWGQSVIVEEPDWLAEEIVTEVGAVLTAYTSQAAKPI